MSTLPDRPPGDPAGGPEVAAPTTPAPRPGPSLLDAVRSGQPTLRHARQLTALAATVGFDWPEIGPVWDKIAEELAELQEAVDQGEPRHRVEAELGDLLLAIANLSRFLDVDPEDALCGAIEKFSRRFKGMEHVLAQRGQRMADLPLDDLEELWVAEKRREG
ncbi:MAG: MazG nucleotide pyrophosphohydrolase domain-containing protein [Myxococcota bacterium]|nr:MazG nucleotide pyrophosphohydrolase domain-containing protein [Myxococcota bacterium]